jgi:hypothetical protein
MNFLTNSAINIIFSVIIFIIAVSGAIWAYRRNKEITGRKKIIFGIIRGLSIFFILLLLLSPFLFILNESREKNVNIFLFDGSGSISLESRKELIKNKFNDILKITPGNSENLYYEFSGNLETELNSGNFDSVFNTINTGKPTNLAKTLEQLKKISGVKRISTINIFSDGIVTDGGNPLKQARETGAVFNYFLTGDTIQKKDILIKKVFFNKIAFKQSSTPIKAEIYVYDYNKQFNVRLFENDLLIDSKTINPIPGLFSYIADFNVISPVETIKKFRIEADVVDGEITELNNKEEFFIKFVDNKFKTVVFSGGPGADFAFLSEEIKKIENLETRFYTQKNQNEFYEGVPANLNDAQVFILAGFPTQNTNNKILEDIKTILSKSKTSLFFINQRNTDYNKLNILNNYLPFAIAGSTNQEYETAIKTVSGIDRELKNNFSSLNDINNFPNIFYSLTSFTSKPSSETILISTKNSTPALIIQNTSNNRAAALLCYGFYKWRLNLKIINAGGVLNSLLSGVILSITNKENKNKITVETDKQIYSNGEMITFTARIYDEEYIKGNEKVILKISGTNYINQIELGKINNSLYTGSIKAETNGDYNFTCELLSGNNIAASDANKFSIALYSDEYKETKADNSILKQLSASTGGKNFNGMDNTEFESFLNDINSRYKENVSFPEKIYLNFNLYYLLFVIFLLCLEWFLRKRNNLP